MIATSLRLCLPATRRTVCCTLFGKFDDRVIGGMRG